MRKHEIPRESKNEGRILYFFNGRSMISTLIGIVLGLFIWFFISFALPTWFMFVVLGIFGGIGFLVGAVKIPEMNLIPVTKSISGLYLDEAIFRYIKFKKRRSLKVLKEEE